MNATKGRLLSQSVQLAAPRSLYFLIFTVSGFSGLIYESIWSHYLKLFLGHAAYAQSLVLIIFMGGMALGSWLASRVSNRSKMPILIYAAAELVVGILALVFHNTFTTMMDGFYNSILPSIGMPMAGAILKWLAASLLITPQSILLGMTFPLMSAGIIRRYPDSPGGSISMLYFTNSIGAAIGVLASGFLMIGALGLPGTMMTAGLLNIALALVVFTLVRLDPDARTKPLPVNIDKAARLPLNGIFLFAAFITGAASFIYEISWIRMLSLVLGATTHSFELMLSAFITGLAFGGLWIKRRIDKIEDPIRFSSYVQLIMGVLAVLTIPIYMLSFDWMTWLLSALSRTEAGYNAYSMASHIIALSVMLPTTFMAGMTLPLFTYVLINKGQGEASIGRIYAANTLGAITGVLFAVHIGLPFLGLKSLIVFGAMLDIGLGLYLLARSSESMPSPTRIAASALVALGAVALTLGTVNVDKKTLISGVYRTGDASGAADDRIIYYQDGKTATVSLRLRPDGQAILSTNGKPDAAIQINAGEPASLDELTMAIAGTLPLAYMPEARRIANIGMGSGQTTHTLLASPQLEVVDTIEIEPAMVAASRNFGRFVSRAYEDPRSNIFIEDAKTFFSLHNSVYDIIIAEPSNPWVSGVSSLFSTEFYDTVKKYLVNDGLFVQWIQLYEFSDELAISILKALTENFSDYMIYTTDGSNILLIARKEGKLPAPNWSAVFDNEYAMELERIGIRSRDDLLVRKLASRHNIVPLLQGARTPTNSDYFPFVDLNAGQARYTGAQANMFVAWSVARMPMLEMLSDDKLRFSNLTKAALPHRLQNIDSAAWIYEQITGSRLNDYTPSGSFVTPELSFLTDWLTLSAANCSYDSDPQRWRFAVHDIVVNSVPFLDVARAEELLRTLSAGQCDVAKSERSLRWLDYYRSLAGRNAEGIHRHGNILLNVEEDVPRAVQGHLVGTTMLAAIAMGRIDIARSTWTDYGAELFGDSGLPDHIALLRSIALNSTRDNLTVAEQ